VEAVPEELRFFTLGLLAFLVWSPAWGVAALAARYVYKSLRRRGEDRWNARVLAITSAVVILVAYIPVYMIIIFSLLDNS
jgi:hypothetical protein